jgi:hypothetical protein
LARDFKGYAGLELGNEARSFFVIYFLAVVFFDKKVHLPGPGMLRLG